MTRAHLRQQGFTLVELMIAMVLGLFLVGGVLSVFLSNSQTYRTNEALSRVQENGRFALEFLASDLRHAGFSSGREVCGGDVPFNPEPHDVVETADPIPLLDERQLRFAINWNEETASQKEKIDEVAATFNRRHPASAQTIVGYIYDKDNTWEPPLNAEIMALNPLASSDAIRILSSRTTTNDNSFIIQTHAAGIIELAAGSDVSDLQDQLADNADPTLPSEALIFMAIDNNCTVGAVFEVTTINEADSEGNATAPRVSLVTNANAIYGNRTTDLGRTFSNGRVVNVSSSARSTSTTYFVAPDPNTNEPTLFRQRNSNNPEPIVDGVEQLHILYGERTGNTINYVTADNVGQWRNVVSLRVSLLVRSLEDNVLTEQQAVVFPPPPNAAVAVNTADRRLRQVFTTTIALRNQLP